MIEELTETGSNVGMYAYYAIRDALEYDFMKTALSFLIIFLVILIISSAITYVRKTKKYRKELSDLFIAGKIRNIAKEENIDLFEEEKRFKSWSKKNKMENRTYEIDDVIEEELNEKIRDSHFKNGSLKVPKPIKEEKSSKKSK